MAYYDLGSPMRTRAILAFQVAFCLFALGQSYVPKGGFVPDPATAVKIAEAVLIPVYGQEKIEAERPFIAKLDKDVWTVSGTLHCKEQNENPNVACLGGTAIVQISKRDARIILLGHER
jgi:NTF2 fold immunity protein